MPKHFDKFMQVLRLKGQSPAKLAQALGSFDPLPAFPPNACPVKATEWLKIAAAACSHILKGNVGDQTMLLVDNVPTVYEHPGFAVVNSVDLYSRVHDPDKVVDYICGTLLRQCGGSEALKREDLRHIRRMLYDYRDHNYYRSYVAAVYTLVNVMAAIRGLTNAMGRYQGWRGMVAECDPSTDPNKARLMEYINNPEAGLLNRTVAALTARLYGVGIANDERINKIVEEILSDPKARTYNKSIHSDCSKTVNDILKYYANLGLNFDEVCPPDCEAMRWLGRLNPANNFGANVLPPEAAKSENGEGDGDGEGEGESKPNGDDKKVANPLENACVRIEDATTPVTKKPTKTSKIKPFSVFVYKRTEDVPESYDVRDLHKGAEPYIRAFGNIAMRVLRPPLPVYGYRSGTLDENSLHRATYDDKLFHRPPTEGKGKVDLTVLIDASGSMSGSRIETAKQVAYALTQVFHKIADIRVYSHNAYHSTCNLQEWSPKSLPILRAGNENADGYAIKYCIEELLQRSDRRKVLIQIADGQPSCSGGYEGTAAYSHVRQVTQSGISKGVTMATIGLDRCIAPHIGNAMYGERFINVYTRELPKIVGRLVVDILS